MSTYKDSNYGARNNPCTMGYAPNGLQSGSASGQTIAGCAVSVICLMVFFAFGVLILAAFMGV